jgi:hypothetical protein
MVGYPPVQHPPAGSALIALLLFGCGAAPPDPPPVAEEAPAAASETAPQPVVRDGVVFPDLPPGAAPSRETVSPLPPRPPVYQLAPPTVPLGQIGAAPNPGPITGYGPGGMGHIPGSPPNPPYR